MPATVALPAAVAEAIVAHARREAPRECCGLLVGEAGRVHEAVPAPNVSDRPDARYVIDPAAHFAAIRSARRRGLAVVGAYHSHPASPAIPSPVDRAEAFTDFLFLIVSLAAPAPELRAWALEAGNFAPIGLVRTA